MKRNRQLVWAAVLSAAVKLSAVSVFRQYETVDSQSVLRSVLASTSYDPGGRPDWTPWHEMTAWSAPGKRVLVCAIPKAGSSSIKSMGARTLSIPAVAAAFARPDTYRVALVRDPLARFASWYADKVKGRMPGPEFYNKALRISNDSVRHGIHDYAAALVRQGVDTTEPHLRSQTRHCALNLLHFDLVHPLEDAKSLTRRILKLLGMNTTLQPLPIKHAVAATNGSDDGIWRCHNATLGQFIWNAYAEDYIWIERHGVKYQQHDRCIPPE